VVVVVGEEPIKDVQYHGLLHDNARRFGRLARTDEQAHAIAQKLLRR